MKRSALKWFGKVMTAAFAVGLLAGATSMTAQASEAKAWYVSEPYHDEENDLTYVNVFEKDSYYSACHVTLIGTADKDTVTFDESSNTVCINNGNYGGIYFYEEGDGLRLYVNDNITVNQYDYTNSYTGESYLSGGNLGVYGNVTLDVKEGASLKSTWVNGYANKLNLADGVEIIYDKYYSYEWDGISYFQYNNVIIRKLTPEAIFAGRFERAMDNIANSVLSAEDGSDVAMEGVASIPNHLMQSLVQKSTVSLTLNFTYEGEEYQVVIPAGTAMDNDIPWYGPLYLMGTYGYTRVADGTFVPACHPDGVVPAAE